MPSLLVNTMMTRFISRNAPGIEFRPIWVRNGNASFAKQHLIKVSLSQGANVRSRRFTYGFNHRIARGYCFCIVMPAY